jgi:hypothetical protein
MKSNQTKIIFELRKDQSQDQDYIFDFKHDIFHPKELWHRYLKTELLVVADYHQKVGIIQDILKKRLFFLILIYFQHVL